MKSAHRRFDGVGAALTRRCPEASVSFGLATLENDDTLDQLTKRADAALYAGRDRVREQPNPLERPRTTG